MKLIIKLVKSIAYVVAVVAIGIALSVFIYRDRLAQQFVSEINKSLSVEISVDEIDIDVLHNFPQVAVKFTEVHISSSNNAPEEFLYVAQMYCLLNPIDLIQGEFKVEGIDIAHGKLYLHYNKQNEGNYKFYRSDSTANKVLDFAVQSVSLSDVNVFVVHEVKGQKHSYYAKRLKGILASKAEVLAINAKGEIKINYINHNGTPYGTNQEFQLQTDLTYSRIEKTITVEKGILERNATKFDVSGTYILGKEDHLNMLVNGLGNSVDDYLSLLPDKVTQKLKPYRLEGQLGINIKLEGDFGKGKSPKLRFDFSVSNGQVHHSDLATNLTNLDFKGVGTMGDISKPKSGVINIEKVTGQLSQESFIGKLMLKDFDKPTANIDFKGIVDAEWVAQLSGKASEIDDVSGIIDCDLSIDYKTLAKGSDVNVSGKVALNNISLILKPPYLPLNEISGNCSFTDNLASFNRLTGKIGNSDFMLEGQVVGRKKNGSYTNIDMMANLNSTILDVDEITDMWVKVSATKKSEGFPALKFYLNSDIEKMNFRRLKAKNIKGRMHYEQQNITLQNLSLDAMKGSTNLTGYIRRLPDKSYFISCDASMEGVAIDSIFYVFENFDQDFIVKENLGGDVYATSHSTMYFDSLWNFQRKLLKSDIHIKVKDGRLMNFEPMNEMSKYIKDENLSDLKFSDLENFIHIGNDTLYLPAMEISNNVRNITVGGYHTLTQDIDYRVAVPIFGMKLDKDEEFGAVSSNGTTGLKLHLKILGNTTDYEVSYDGKAAKKSIFNKLKLKQNKLKEVSETKQKEEVVLEEDFFDWDN